MALRFFRRIRLAPGLTLNLSKRGASLSAGPRGAKITGGTSGVRRTVGLPGTGLRYTQHTGRQSTHSRRTTTESPAGPASRPQDRLDLGFFRRLVTPRNEQHFIDGMRHIVQGKEAKALEHLEQAAHLPDAAFMAGMLMLKRKHYDKAICYLEQARGRCAELGKHCRKYGIAAAVSLPITERIDAEIEPNIRGILLALAEAEQARDKWQSALNHLEQLRRRAPDDPIVLLALVEILVEEIGDENALHRVTRLTKDIDNEDAIHAALLLWKGKALRRLGLATAARDTLSTAFRRKKDRSEELLRAIRYERALAYEALDQARRYREELERLYAEDPDYEDIAQRLGLKQGC